MAMRLAARCFRTPVILACKRSSPCISSKLVATSCVQNVENNGIHEKTSVAHYVTFSRDGSNETTGADVLPDEPAVDPENLMHDLGAEMNVESILMKDHVESDFELEGTADGDDQIDSAFEIDHMLLQHLNATVEELVQIPTEDILVQNSHVHDDVIEMNIESIMMNGATIEGAVDKSQDHTSEVESTADKVAVGENQGLVGEMDADSVILDEGLEEVEDDEDYHQTDDEIRTQILSVALDNVPLFGWSTESIEKAVEALELSPSSSDLFKRGALDLVLFFIEEGNNALIEHIAADAKKTSLNSEDERTDFIEKAIKTRLQMIIPYIDSWPQAMKLMASPMAAREVFENGANLLDEILYHSGDFSTDMSWYAKRGVLTGINLSTELFMLNDKSPDYRDTWAFLHRRMQDAKTLHYAKDSLTNAASDTMALANAGITLAQNVLGINSKQR